MKIAITWSLRWLSYGLVDDTHSKAMAVTSHWPTRFVRRYIAYGQERPFVISMKLETGDFISHFTKQLYTQLLSLLPGRLNNCSVFSDESGGMVLGCAQGGSRTP